MYVAENFVEMKFLADYETSKVQQKEEAAYQEAAYLPFAEAAEAFPAAEAAYFLFAAFPAAEAAYFFFARTIASLPSAEAA